MQEFVAHGEIGVKQKCGGKAEQAERGRTAPRIPAYRDRCAGNELQGDDERWRKRGDAHFRHTGR